jgi:hypothetical protein
VSASKKSCGKKPQRAPTAYGDLAAKTAVFLKNNIAQIRNSELATLSFMS